MEFERLEERRRIFCADESQNTMSYEHMHPLVLLFKEVGVVFLPINLKHRLFIPEFHIALISNFLKSRRFVKKSE